MRDERLEPLERAVRAAGELALSYFGKTVTERKLDRTVVTEADRAVERFLAERLLAIDAGARVLGEEGTSEVGAGSATWAIDPIDGTAMFVAGLPTWSISVGLVRNGEPELGCVYLPVSGEMFLAGADGPLQWNGLAIDRSAEPGAWNGQSFDSQAWVGLSSSHHRRMRVTLPKVRGLGSTASHFAWVARGGAVAAVAFARLWDVAGGLACCRAAGVAYTYLSGAPVDLGALLHGERTPEPIVAAHPRDLEAVRRHIELLPPSS